MGATVSQAIGRERPLGVVIIALFLLVDSVVSVIQVIFDTTLSTRTDTLLDINEWMPGFVVAMGGVRVVTAVGLWLGRRWAWVLSMLVVGVGLVMGFYLYWLGDPGYLRLLINVVMAFYLNQGAVRDYFERGETVAVEDEVAP